MGLAADQAQPDAFTLTIAGPYAFPADGAQRVMLYYDRGFQALSGTAAGNSISIPLDASNFPQFLHGFTAGRSMLIAEGRNPAFEVNLTGSSAAVAALGQCTEAAGFTELPPPWHAAAALAAVASTADQSGANDGSGSGAPPIAGDAQQVDTSSSPPVASAQAAESSPAPLAVSTGPDAVPASSSEEGNGGTVFILLLLAGAGIIAWQGTAAIRRRKEAAARDLEELRRRRLAQEEAEEQERAEAEAREAALRREQLARQLIAGEIDRQAARLGIRRSQLVFADFYGTPDLSKWTREIELFCATRLLPMLESQELGYLWLFLEREAIAHIERAAVSNSQAPSVAPGFVSDPAVFDPRMDPLDYERHCALLLRDAGWDATLTPATGDQGADVIAEKAGIKLVVQCKLYSQTVGNDAVQEAFAAKNFQRGQLAAVVSNAPFTPSARQLAMTTGVLLLHHEELRTLMVENVYGNVGGSGSA